MLSDALNASHTVDELKKLAKDLKEMVEIFIMRHLHRRRIGLRWISSMRSSDLP